MAATIGNLTHLSEAIVYNLFVLTAISAVTLLVGAGAIAIRLRIPDRRFLVQKAQRREGTYWVPHTPIIASLWIIAYSLSASTLRRLRLSDRSRHGEHTRFNQQFDRGLASGSAHRRALPAVSGALLRASRQVRASSSPLH